MDHEVGTSSRLNFVGFHKIFGHVFFLGMLAFSIVYAAERITYVDSAWLSFERINGEQLTFPGNRYSAFFSELLLWFATKMHLPFKTLVYIFSTSYILLYYVVWRICTYKLKSPVAGLVIILGMVVGVREAFLHTVSETHQCFVYSALLYAVLMFEFKNNRLKLIIITFVTLLVLYAHPLGIFSAAFVIAYFAIHIRQLNNPSIYLVAGIIVLVILLNLFFPANPYDEAQFQKLSSTSGSESLFSSGALNFLKIHFTHFYWLPELAALVAGVWLVIKKDYLRLVCLVIGAIGYTAIASVTFRSGDSSIMIERIFLPTFFMINLVLADLLFKHNKNQKWIPIVFVLFFVFNGIRYINAGCLMYKKRVAYLDELVQKAMAGPGDKYILDESVANKEIILVPWALGVETLIYSKFKYDKCVTITLDKEGCDPTSARVTTSICLPVSELNPEYFQLSTNPYQPLPNE